VLPASWLPIIGQHVSSGVVYVFANHVSWKQVLAALQDTHLDTCTGG